MSLKLLNMSPALLLIFCGSAALAQHRAPEHARDCVRIADDAERLTCYDRMMSGDTSVPGDGEAGEPAVGGAGAGADLFGLPRQPDPTQEEKERQVSVAAARKSPENRWIFLLEDGQVWIQTDSSKRLVSISPGTAAKISAAALGSFLMSIDGRTIRVRRIR